MSLPFSEPSDAVETESLSEEAWFAAIRRALTRLALTHEQLEKQAEHDNFVSTEARKLWYAIKRYDQVYTPSVVVTAQGEVMTESRFRHLLADSLEPVPGARAEVLRRDSDGQLFIEMWVPVDQHPDSAVMHIGPIKMKSHLPFRWPLTQCLSDCSEQHTYGPGCQLRGNND